MGLLGDIFSFGNTVKRNVKGLLADPSGTLEQWGDQAKNYGNNVVPTISGGLLDNRQMTEAEQMQKYMELASVAPIGIFAGVNAKTADLAKQAMAEKMLKAGDDPAKVWRETGWGKGPDGKWRFEIPDNRAANAFSYPSHERMRDIAGGKYITSDKFMREFPNTDEAFEMRTRNSMMNPVLNDDTPTLADSFSHRLLVDAYPELGSIKTVINNKMAIGNAGYSQPRNTIMLSPVAGKEADSLMLHELQHAVQRNEGFAKGGRSKDLEVLAEEYAQMKGMFDEAVKTVSNAKADDVARSNAEQIITNLGPKLAQKKAFADPYEAYKRLSGEAEARLTESRMNMDAAQRAAQYPWEANYFQEATGVPLNGLLFRYD